MSLSQRFEENLYGRIGVFNGFLSREQLEECLEEERSSEGRLDLGALLLKKGYLNEEQLGKIQEIRRKKIRKMLRDTKEIQRSEKAFGQIALRRGWIELKDLEAAIVEQERLAKMNLQFRLGEVLVSRGKLEVDQVLEILNEQQKRILHCPTCDFHYSIFDFRPEHSYRCRKCGDSLEDPVFLDPIAVDGVIDGLPGVVEPGEVLAGRVDGGDGE